MNRNDKNVNTEIIQFTVIIYRFMINYNNSEYIWDVWCSFITVSVVSYLFSLGFNRFVIDF